MKFSITTIGDLGKLMAEEIKAAEKAVTSGVSQAADGLKTELRTQITAAGLGTRLPRTWRGQVYPRGKDSIQAAGLVWSKAPDIIRVYEDGATIRSKRGFFLAIPTAVAGRYGDGGMPRLSWWPMACGSGVASGVDFHVPARQRSGQVVGW